MYRYMLDTNICIKITSAKTKPEVKAKLFPRLDRATGLVCVSSITVAELRWGIEKADPAYLAKNLQALGSLLARAPALSFDEAAAEAFGRVKHAMTVAGRQIGPYDMQIAAHAASQNLTVVTNNIGEFNRVDGLPVEDWTA